MASLAAPFGSASASASKALAFDIDPLLLPGVPAAPPAPASPPAPAPSRSRRRRAKRAQVGGAGTAVSAAADFDAEAPWAENTEAEAREEREERREALRKAIAARRTQRTGRHALAARSEKRAATTGGEDFPLSQLDPSQLSSATLAAAAARIGIPASQLPSRRALMRRLGSMSAEELLAGAGAKGLRA